MKKFFDVVLNATGGAPLEGATVTVMSGGDPADLYSDESGTPLDNPVTTNENGYYEFYVDDGEYDLEFRYAGQLFQTVTDVSISTEVTNAELAATTGAALVGTTGGGTVQSDITARPTSAVLAASSGSSLVGFLQAGTGAVAETAEDQMRRALSIQSFATPGGVVDATTGVQNAINQAVATGNYLDGHGATFRLTSVINIPTTGPLRLRNVKLIVDHAGTGIADSGGTVARCYFENVRLLAEQNAAIAWDCNQWQYCQWINCFVGSNDGTSNFARAWKLSNVSYWNTFYSPEVEAAPIAWDLNDCNDTRFFMPRHVRFGTIGTPSTHATNSILFSGGCSGISVFGPSFENLYTSADVIKFHADCEQCYVFGGRIEARADSTAVLPVKFNGAEENGIIGMYMVGAGISTLSDIATYPNNKFDVFQSGATAPRMGKGHLIIPYNTASAGDVGAVNYNTSTGRFTGNTTAGGARNFLQTPAQENIDANGFAILNIQRLFLQTGNGDPGSPAAGSQLQFVDSADGNLYLRTSGGVKRMIQRAAAIQTVTGSRGGNAALASLLTALAVEGIIVDGTTA